MLQPEPTLLTAALLAPFLLEALKYLWRRFVAKNPDFDFSKLFYTLAVPFSALVAQIVTGFLGWSVMPDVSVSYVIQWVLGILVTLGTYQMVLKPFKEYKPSNPPS